METMDGNEQASPLRTPEQLAKEKVLELTMTLTLEEERALRRSEQDAKDKALAEKLKSIQMESAKRNHSITATKKALYRSTRKTSEKRLAKLREDTKRSLQLASKDSEALLERLASTFRTLELNSGAHELEQWCAECGCIHMADLLREDDEKEEEEGVS